MIPYAFPAAKFDPDLLVAAQKRNVDALTGMSQIMADGMRAFAERQSEIAQVSMKHFMAETQTFMTSKPTEIKPGDVTGKAKTAYEAAIANAQELGNIVVKAQSDAINLLNKAAIDNFDDIKKISG